MRSGGTRSFVVRALTIGVAASVALPLVISTAVDARRPPVVPPPAITPNVADRFATDQLIVKMKDGSIPNVANLIAQAGENVQLKHRESNGAWVGKLTVRRPMSSMSALAAKIAALPGVAYAEPDAIMVPYFTPTDPNYGAQWDLVAPVAGKYGANLPTAWDTTKGTSDVVVAVIDTGITNHADLAGQTVPGYDMITDIPTANDGNGRDADPSDPGDWCGASSSSWHGTHVAGTIAALQNNGIGVTGIAPGVKIEPVRVLGTCGGYTSDIADALRWAAGLNVPGVPANANPAAVLSLSLGGTGTCPATYTQAINDVTAIGATIVIAAGNSNADSAGYNPGNCPGVITVAATGPTGNRAYYSNYGTGIEIAAQGGDTSLTAPAGATSAGILSTMNAGTTTPTTDTYAYYQGTSMATPHVSGVAALIKSVDPAATPAQVLSFIQNNVTAFPAGSTCTTALCGTGILNAAAAVSAAGTAYGPRVLGAFSKTSPAPGTLAVTDPVTLTWTASAGATSYDYCVVATLAAPCTWITAGNVTSVTVSGLASGTVYSWQVRATDGTNTAEANVSLRSSFTTWAPTPAPTAFTKTAPANASQVGGASTTLAWSASTNALTYEYCYDSTLTGTCTGTWTSTAATSATVSGLVVGTTYEWSVRAVNPTGTTYADSGTYFTFTDTTLPSAGAFTKTAPLNAGTVTGTTASLTWAASTNATGYDVCLDSIVNNTCDGLWNVFGNISAVTATGLVAGTTYEWQVRANASGGSTLADNATAFTFLDSAALPGAFNKSTPASLSTGLATTPTLAWNASTSATSYEYCIDTTNDTACTSPAVWVSTGTARTALLSGLLNSTTYYWQARARNTSGTTDANTGAWWSFTTAAPALPGAFTKSAPLNAATGAAIATTLSWAAAASATSYEYCIDTTADSTCNSGVWIPSGTGGTARTAALTGLAYSTTYQWQVRARNAVGTTDATTGTWWTFTTVAPPALGTFNKSAPATNATGQGSTGTVNLTWAASTNATSFEYCIDAVVNSICDSGVWTTTPVLATRSVAFTGFAWNTKYEWQVRSRNAGGFLAANAGTWFVFTTLAPPASPSKTSPTNGQTARPLTQALSWGTATGATGYEYCIDTTNNSTCDSGVWTSTTGTTRTASPAGLVTKTTYYWQVRAKNAAGATEGNAGAWWSFVTV